MKKQKSPIFKVSLDNIGEAYDKGENGQSRFHALIHNK